MAGRNHRLARRLRTVLGTALIALVMAQLPAAETQTRSATPGAPAPEARVADLAWMVGRWAGPGIDGAPSGESWSFADGSRLVGHFFQQTPDGSLRFLEIMMLHPVGNSIELRLKHFNPDLTGWEKQEDFTVFPLVAVEPDVWYFNGLTIRRIDAEHMTITVRLRARDGRSSEIPFVYARQEGG